MINRRQFGALALSIPLASLPLARAFADVARDRVLGDENAPVTMIEYSSLTCPHCASFHAGPLKELKSKYIDTGKLKIVYRDFPTDGLALLISQLPHCVGDGQYFGLLDYLFQQQATWRDAQPDGESRTMVDDLGLSDRLSEQGFSKDDIYGVSGKFKAAFQIAAISGLSAEAAADCMADAELRDSIWKRAEAGREEFAVRSTPSFIIDGETHAGSRSIEAFSELIDPLL